MPAAIPATSWRVEGSARFDSSHIAAPHTAQVTAYGAQHTTTVQIQDGEGGFGASTLLGTNRYRIYIRDIVHSRPVETAFAVGR